MNLSQAKLLLFILTVARVKILMRMLFINQVMYVIQSVVFISHLWSLMSLQYMMMNTVVVTLRESIFLYMCEYIIHSNLYIHQVVISTL